MKCRVIKKISLSLFLVAMACGQQLSAESHYIAPRYAVPSFASEAEQAPGLPQVPPALDQDKQDAQASQNGQESGQENGVVTALPYFGPVEDEEEVLESRINVPGDED